MSINGHVAVSKHLDVDQSSSFIMGPLEANSIFGIQIILNTSLIQAQPPRPLEVKVLFLFFTLFQRKWLN